ncbi:Wound-induced protein WIN2 [Linum perenne]
MVLILVLISVSVSIVVNGENEDHRCTCCHDYDQYCDVCDTSVGRCCSPFKYCGSGPGYCSAAPPSTSPSTDQQIPSGLNLTVENLAQDGPAKSRYSNGTMHDTVVVASYDRNLVPQGSSTLTSDENMMVVWRRSYGWATICGSTVEAHHVDGHCLKVTNSENGKQAVVRIKQKECSDNTASSLEIDYDVFQRLDKSDHRNASSQILTSYKYVNCTDY